MPRFRRSGATLSRRDGSKKVSSPTSIVPASGRWKPARDISVVDLPQPDGPSSVKSSPSRTEKPTWSSARWWPNSLTSPSTWISGIVISLHSELQDSGADRESGDRADGSLDELRQHRRPHHLRPRLDEEQRRVVVVEHLDEHQDERGEDRRPEQRQDDPAAGRPPARAHGAAGAVELLPDPRQRRVHHHVGERQIADAEGDRDAPDARPQVIADGAREQVRPEEADADDQPRRRPRVEHHDRQRPPEREARSVSDQGRKRDDRRRRSRSGER